MTEHKSDAVTLHINGEPLMECIVERLSIQVTQFEVLIRGECRNTHEDKVLFSPDALERLGYAPDCSDLAPVSVPFWRRLWKVLAENGGVAS